MVFEGFSNLNVSMILHGVPTSTCCSPPKHHGLSPVPLSLAVLGAGMSVIWGFLSLTFAGFYVPG